MSLLRMHNTDFEHESMILMSESIFEDSGSGIPLELDLICKNTCFENGTSSVVEGRMTALPRELMIPTLNEVIEATPLSMRLQKGFEAFQALKQNSYSTTTSSDPLSNDSSACALPAMKMNENPVSNAALRTDIACSTVEHGNFSLEFLRNTETVDERRESHCKEDRLYDHFDPDELPLLPPWGYVTSPGITKRGKDLSTSKKL